MWRKLFPLSSYFPDDCATIREMHGIKNKNKEGKKHSKESTQENNQVKQIGFVSCYENQTAISLLQ